MVKPVDTTKDLYYQVYDTTSLWGNNYLTDMPKPVSTQKYGMDFMWNTYYVHDDHHRDSNYYFLNGSPNTPYINGMNITNRDQYFSTVYKNTGLKEGRREGRQEGRQEGIQAVVELLQEMELEKEVICGKVQEKFQISSEEAAQEVEKYWK